MTELLLLHPFTKHDGGRSMSQRPKEKNDCTVRALAIVTGLEYQPGLGWGVRGSHYDAVYDLLKSDGSRATNRGVSLDRFIYGRLSPVLGESQTIFGWTAKRQTFPAVKGQRRMNPVTFHQRFPEGRYIVSTARHVYAVIDGVAYDTHAERPDRCIYAAWQFMKVESK